MLSESSPRLVPLPESEWDPILYAIRRELRPVLNVHRVQAHHPRLFSAWGPLRNHIATGGTLPPRLRELVILRIAHRTASNYEWHQHVSRARREGLTDGEIEAVRTGAAVRWERLEATLLMAADELFDDRSLSDETWDSLTAELTTEQILDLIFTVGAYVTMAMLIAATGVPLEE